MKNANQIKFNPSGKLIIMQVSDPQDMKYVRPAMVKMLNNAYDAVKPDLVLFTGDNILGNHLLDARIGNRQIASGKEATLKVMRESIDNIAAPLQRRGIPFAMIYGNHDDRNLVSKDEQADIFRSYSCCLPMNIDDPTVDCDTYNIPEISKDKPAAVDERPHRYFKKTADQFDDTTIYKPFGQSENTSRPAYTSNSPIGAVDETAQPTVPDFGADDYGKVEVEKPAKAKKGKSGKGILAGRIISIVLLCATVLTFVFGCVISIFINNNGTNLAGYCFNSMYQTVDDLGVSKGDLIISKKLSASEYQTNTPVAVPAPDGQTGCDIQYITAVTPMGSNDCDLTTAGISGGYQVTNTYSSATCYGTVKFFVPFFGGLITFAMDNAILVCALFILLSAFWCLMLIMLEKSGNKAKKSKK